MKTKSVNPNPQTVPMISYYAHCKPGLDAANLSANPVRFSLADQFVRTEDQPIRAIDDLKLEFAGTDFEEVVLLNFHLTRNWPMNRVDWTPHCDPSNLDVFNYRCVRQTEGVFLWDREQEVRHVVPTSVRSYINEFIGADEYAILKFDVLAKHRNGHWHFVDPGVGLKKGG
jgi:hypothetical protein